MNEQEQQEIVIATQSAELVRLRQQVFKLQQEANAAQARYDVVNRDGMSFLRRATRAEEALAAAKSEAEFLRDLVAL